MHIAKAKARNENQGALFYHLSRALQRLELQLGDGWIKKQLPAETRFYSVGVSLRS
jgi:hypothetical protein